MPEPAEFAARFLIHLRCPNCMRNLESCLDVPAVDDAPTTPEELADSAFLQRQRFLCIQCDSAIGTIIGITMVRPELLEVA
ncbi:hypothetical protein FG93_01965 [Bosea sp. LC85]|uniref:hypothetical protein n=1 Tax=Bosea sp. LC85 TaxID=1502851 RepID=UPI0004E2E79C|nr:hypothetical protein [Bosea sp. LC85]KFC73221.1 hypothetical protein FG93_01965 [Bosea sp. LC85]